ncbi:MAG TPA: MFS transporter [Ktedonobacteraceae bacterium]|nr:MFS transporter [Ktedonobacteraceae bacterium]
MDLVSQSGGFLTLLKKRNFLRLWLAQVISQTIFNASNAALIVLISLVSGNSTTQIGLAIICFSLPAVLFGAPAGVVVDHMSKRRVLWASNGLRALATIFFVLALFFDRRTLLPIIYLLTFIISTIGQFFTPAEGSTIPMLVDEEELTPALSLFNTTLMLAQALGFVLIAPIALFLLPTFTIYGITIDAVIQLYAIIAILYLVCSALVFAIPSASFVKSEVHYEKAVNNALSTQILNALSNVWDETKQGWKFVRQTKTLFLAVVQLSFAGVLILVIGEEATPIVTKLLFLSPKLMAFIFAPAGIGLVAGSVLIPRVISRFGGSKTIFAGALVLTGCMAALPLCALVAQVLQPHGWNTNPLLLLTIAFIMCIAGFALDAINVPAQTAIQTYTPDWIKGRVLALQLVLYNAASIPVILILGAITDSLNITNTLLIMAAMTLAFGLWGIYYERNHPHSELPNQEHAAATENSVATSSAKSH